MFNRKTNDALAKGDKERLYLKARLEMYRDSARLAESLYEKGERDRDTHITTIVSCLFLFLFGTGPVKGFAVTLVIGLIANVFTAVFVSKVIFEYELSRKKQVTALSI